MLLFPGPTKVDLLFLDETREWSPPWDPSPETLEAIDCHFWDWILWLEQKRRGGRDEILTKGLEDMYDLMLRPMGAVEPPRSVAAALAAYLRARGVLEDRFGQKCSRDLEREVRPLLPALPPD
jgi:hypothetical protein